MDQHLAPPTLKEFYNNPSGKGITANNISLVRAGLIHRYELFKKKGKKIKTDIYMEAENSFYFHMIIPSDMNMNDYDVVIHFYDPANDEKHGNIKDWCVEFFSNCPSFIFTYAVAYNEAGLFIPFLGNKLNNKVLSNLPAEKNPDLTVGWDKSIFYAIHEIKTHITLTQRFLLKRNAKPFIAKEFVDLIRDEDQIMQECKDGKVTKVRTYSIKQSTASKAKDAIVNPLKHVAVKAVDKVVGKQKTAGITQPKRYKVNINSKGKIVGATKIRGNHGGRRRK